MKFLFIHQNFPAQFRSIFEELSRSGMHEVLAFRRNRLAIETADAPVATYRLLQAPQERQHPLLRELESKILRAEGVAEACRRLDARGWRPDVVVVHPGWGEAMLIRDVWPEARLVSYAEYFYAPTGQDFGFDPEFPADDPTTRSKLRLKNTAMLHALNDSDALWTSTEWQRSLFPAWARDRIRVIHEGVETDYFKPDPHAAFEIAGKGLRITRDDEVITYASRSLEPVRGFHVFMRALPEILERRPRAHVVIMGREDTSYGPAPKEDRSWLARAMREVGDRLDPARVHLAGFLPREAYRTVLQVSAAHVHLTYPFVLSWSVVEALACGVRLVASDTAPVREVLPPNSAPYTFEFFDRPGLVQAVCNALERTPSMREAEASAARALICERYARQTQMRSLMDFLAS